MSKKHNENDPAAGMAEVIEVVQEAGESTERTPGTGEAGASASPEELVALRDQAAKAEENRDLYIRAMADLDNFRKRAARERQDAVKYANESLLNRIIPVLDSFELALAATDSAHEAVRDGVKMIFDQLRGALTEAGLQEVDAAGQAFDPALHEAVSMLETAETPDGHVVQQLRKGYRLNDRLMRPATVVVARAPSTPSA
ncbi:MAG: nucleotide exchange factor GrpE [Verrucomicrobiales bacterium]|nr:nucleotide exchange factor GrpE [Verrucomicrobiales bacterium]